MIEIDEHFEVDAAPRAVYGVLSDVHAVVECVPGATIDAERAGGSFDASLTIKFSGLRAKFAGTVTVNYDDDSWRGEMVASGKEGRGGTRFRVEATFAVHGVDDDQRSQVETHAVVELTGSLTSVIESAAGTVTRRMSRDFAAALGLRCASAGGQVQTAVASGEIPLRDQTAAGEVRRTAAVLMLHEEGGSPATVRRWGESLVSALGAEVQAPRLPGHGVRWQDLRGMTWRGWYKTAEEAFGALRSSHDVVFVMGVSVGATLALRLAESYGADVGGVVAVNPVISGFVRPVGAARLLAALRRSVPIVADVRRPGVRHAGYARLPNQTLATVRDLGQVTGQGLASVVSPVLLVVSAEDHVISRVDGELVERGLSASPPRRLEVSDSYHLVPIDNDAERLATESARFVESFAVSDAGQADEAR